MVINNNIIRNLDSGLKVVRFNRSRSRATFTSLHYGPFRLHTMRHLSYSAVVSRFKYNENRPQNLARYLLGSFKTVDVGSQTPRQF